MQASYKTRKEYTIVLDEDEARTITMALDLVLHPDAINPATGSRFTAMQRSQAGVVSSALDRLENATPLVVHSAR
jgi:hypothetical protein